MVEHVGKKRRKEVRDAITLKKAVNKKLRIMVIVIVAAFAWITAMYFLMKNGLVPMNIWFEILPLFVLVLISGWNSNRWAELRNDYKSHCRKHNITREDMRALKNGDL